jgi:hypothetical protein
VIIDPRDLAPKGRCKLLIGSVVSRPIAWTSTASPDGVLNLAPFSFFTVASRKPSFSEVQNPVQRPGDLEALGGGRDGEPEHPVDLVALVSGEPVEVLRDLRGHRLQQGVAVEFESLVPLLGDLQPPISCSFINPAACWCW